MVRLKNGLCSNVDRQRHLSTANVSRLVVKLNRDLFEHTPQDYCLDHYCKLPYHSAIIIVITRDGRSDASV